MLRVRFFSATRLSTEPRFGYAIDAPFPMCVRYLMPVALGGWRTSDNQLVSSYGRAVTAVDSMYDILVGPGLTAECGVTVRDRLQRMINRIRIAAIADGQ